MWFSQPYEIQANVPLDLLRHESKGPDIPMALLTLVRLKCTSSDNISGILPVSAIGRPPFDHTEGWVHTRVAIGRFWLRWVGQDAGRCPAILLYIPVEQFCGHFRNLIRNLIHICGHILNSNCRKLKISMASCKCKDDFQHGLSIHFSKILRVNDSTLQKRLFRYNSTFKSSSWVHLQALSKRGRRRKGEGDKGNEKGGGRRVEAKDTLSSFKKIPFI